MAILISGKTEHGIDLKNGYFKITDIHLDNDDNVRFSGTLWLNQTARYEDKQPLVKIYYMNSFKTMDKTGNLLEQVYNYITELAETYDSEKALFGSAEKA